MMAGNERLLARLFRAVRAGAAAGLRAGRLLQPPRGHAAHALRGGPARVPGGDVLAASPPEAVKGATPGMQSSICGLGQWCCAPGPPAKDHGVPHNNFGKSTAVSISLQVSSLCLP